MSVSLFGAWHLWLSGKPLTGLKLWGVNIIWWGRIGKILEFLAAYAVIVEIAGSVRLQRYGKSFGIWFREARLLKSLSLLENGPGL